MKALLASQSYLNRTLLELKQFVPSFDLNQVSYLNRTLLELKQCWKARSFDGSEDLNRTLLELKLNPIGDALLC